jgi:hypothetical protein
VYPSFFYYTITVYVYVDTVRGIRQTSVCPRLLLSYGYWVNEAVNRQLSGRQENQGDNQNCCCVFQECVCSVIRPWFSASLCFVLLQWLRAVDDANFDVEGKSRMKQTCPSPVVALTICSFKSDKM